MDGWLKDDFRMDEKAEKAEQAEMLAVRQIAQRVTARAARRRAFQRAIASSSVLALALCAVVGTYLYDGSSLVPRPSSDATIASSLIPHPSSALPVALSKVDHSVAITWKGNPEAEYTVYRCNSPKFDTCSLADLVKGTQWVDTGAETGIIVFYRVEKKA